jgi:hypothetical protein
MAASPLLMFLFYVGNLLKAKRLAGEAIHSRGLATFTMMAASPLPLILF